MLPTSKAPSPSGELTREMAALWRMPAEKHGEDLPRTVLGEVLLYEGLMKTRTDVPGLARYRLCLYRQPFTNERPGLLYFHTEPPKSLKKPQQSMNGQHFVGFTRFPCKRKRGNEPGTEPLQTTPPEATSESICKSAVPCPCHRGRGCHPNGRLGDENISQLGHICEPLFSHKLFPCTASDCSSPLDTASEGAPAM